MIRRTLVGLSVIGCVACAGSSGTQVGALEAQVKELAENRAKSEDLSALQERVWALQAQTTESAKSYEERLAKVESQLKSGSKARGSQGAVAQTQSAQAFRWELLGSVFGVDAVGIQEKDGGYVLRRPWLQHQLMLLALSGKGPKFSDNRRGGVQIRGIKRKGLADRLGLKNNDIILTIGERDVQTAAQIVEALRRLEASATVKILRKKDEVVLQYALID
ncbi:MAG: PDZ domain-containing protein [Myxococcota bacterium]